MPLTKSIDHLFEPLKVFLDVEDPVWKAWRVMKENKVKTLAVKKKERIVGIVSDRDIVQASEYNGGQGMPVKEAMSLNPLVIKIGLPLSEVLVSMLQKEQSYAIVINSNEEVVGSLSWENIFNYFLKNDEFSFCGMKAKES